VTAGERGWAQLIDRMLQTDLADLEATTERQNVALAMDDDTPVLVAPHRETLLLTRQSGGDKRGVRVTLSSR
jgi:hypothetical protein